MTQITLTRSQNIGFVLYLRVPAHQLAPDFDECGALRQAKKISRPGWSKEGRVAILKSEA